MGLLKDAEVLHTKTIIHSGDIYPPYLSSFVDVLDGLLNDIEVGGWDSDGCCLHGVVPYASHIRSLLIDVDCVETFLGKECSCSDETAGTSTDDGDASDGRK